MNQSPARAGRLPGLLITFEGPEGSGKTTLVHGLTERLVRSGVEPVVVREPGGTDAGEQIRHVLLDPAGHGLCAEAELLLMIASRAQLVREKLQPALAAGLIVLCDRFADASVAYQGWGRELGVDVVEPEEEGRFRLVNLFGEQKIIKGKLKSMNLVNHKILFEK